LAQARKITTAGKDWQQLFVVSGNCCQ